MHTCMHECTNTGCVEENVCNTDDFVTASLTHSLGTRHLIFRGLLSVK